MGSVIFSIYLFSVAYQFALQNSQWQVICVYSGCFLNEAGRAMFRSCVIFNGLTVISYIIIGILMVKINATQQIKESRQIFKSLIMIMVVVIIGWMVNGILEIVMPYVAQNGAQIWFTTRLGAFFINIASGLNLPILYVFRFV
uniref:G-protein coupled receptors family 1 profile domain-containing protein n=1 Tax=Ditylenchus dipsaci TaxID=166011 RepID=A0A915DIH6_9BILA